MRRNKQTDSERIVKDIKRKTRKQYSAEEKIRIVLDGLRGEESIAELCRQEGIAQGLYYNGLKTSWKRVRNVWLVILFVRLIHQKANTSEVKNLRQQTRDLKEVVAEQTLELRLLKKSMIGNGDDDI